jgi:hypothetical protein
MENIGNDLFSKSNQIINSIKNAVTDAEKLDIIVTYLAEVNTLLAQYGEILTKLTKNQQQIADFQTITSDTIGKINTCIDSNAELIEIHGKHLDEHDKHLGIHDEYFDVHDKLLDAHDIRIELLSN